MYKIHSPAQTIECIRADITSVPLNTWTITWPWNVENFRQHIEHAQTIITLIGFWRSIVTLDLYHFTLITCNEVDQIYSN